ncbi:MAG: NAD-dependent epimerase/dehydratase family protein [Euryarchaeota archaeon]|nr:NAD-dependent epimerase/dehydratase family protein [Euryarchaeota archaeon]MDE1835759.1 NAD-dependent epimerase/dehydratase family protein [Euryarchaeota archaeon]MDE1881537.1 NAD-dependent epimerase/dehydratase family protein [Euryarchaeota archaeon]MDE2043950.1 NAD-dependent epimerase/dehydratase family protein [Thermoplasmata archaeon]
MKVLITGVDGYSGWPLALHLLQRGHEVVGLDNFVTRQRVAEVGSWSATPVLDMHERIAALQSHGVQGFRFYEGDLCDFTTVKKTLHKEKPEVIVHLGEQRSAPYSMIDVHHAVATQCQNLTSTLHIVYAMRDECPKAHLVKMGTMGEYGTPNLDIAEGFFEVEFRGRKDRVPFPRQASSWYHWSKVFDTGDVMLANKLWGLATTDVMQGVIYGTRTPEITQDWQLTRFDFDEVWGTALNRFCVQAVLGLPLTPYGKGGQKRGFIALEDSMQSLRLAVEHPADPGEYRVFNQFDEAYSVGDLAKLVLKVGEKLGIKGEIHNSYNPRVELEEHYYHPLHDNLLKLGYQHQRTLEEALEWMLSDLQRFRARLEEKRAVVLPRMDFRVGDNKSRLHIEKVAKEAVALPKAMRKVPSSGSASVSEG